MIWSPHLNTKITSIIQRVISLVHQLPDGILPGCVYRELAIFKEGNHTVPKTPQIIESSYIRGYGTP